MPEPTGTMKSEEWRASSQLEYFRKHLNPTIQAQVREIMLMKSADRDELLAYWGIVLMTDWNERFRAGQEIIAAMTKRPEGTLLS